MTILHCITLYSKALYYEYYAITLPILQMKKLRHRDAQNLPKSHSQYMVDLGFKSGQSDYRVHAFCSNIFLLSTLFASTSLPNFYSSMKTKLKNDLFQGMFLYHPSPIFLPAL